MRLTRIYTKTGDKGVTTLASGEKISKGARRLEAYGSVDELNSWIGLLRDQIQALVAFQEHWVSRSLERIQNELFDLGGELATPSKIIDPTRQRLISLNDIKYLEDEIDRVNEQLPALANFVLPGGHTGNSTAHLARTVCRRAERELVRFHIEESEVRSEALIYLNRLSDWLFVMSRLVSHTLGTPEVLWQQKRSEP